MRTKRVLVGASIALGTALVAAPALASTGCTLTPSTQNVAYNQAASWGAAWTGKAPFTVTFAYGDGISTTLTNTSSTSKGFTHTFSSCTGGPFTQRLTVKDAAGLTSSASATTNVGRSPYC